MLGVPRVCAADQLAVPNCELKSMTLEAYCESVDPTGVTVMLAAGTTPDGVVNTTSAA